MLVLRAHGRRGCAATSLAEVDSALRITFSAGLAAAPRTAKPFADTITRADKALYSAKSAGRNRIIAA